MCEIALGDKRHQLLMPLDGRWHAMLLTLGTGTYTVSIYEAGYWDKPVRLLYADTVRVNALPADEELALMSSMHTELADHPLTRALARELTQGLETDSARVEAIWAYLMDNARYDSELARAIQYSEIPDGDCFVRGEKGICCDFAAFLACALREIGIPCKHVYGLRVKTHSQHAWNEVYLDGAWVTVDATLSRKDKNRRFHAEKASDYAPDTGLWDGWH